MSDTTWGIQIREVGGPERLLWEQLPLGKPGRGEVLIRQTAVGLNYIDTYLRSGVYPLALPAGLGGEAAGVVEAVGPGTRSLRPGDRVAYHWAAIPGAYVQHRVVPVAQVFRLPRSISNQLAAASLLKGLTCWVLLREVHRVRAGETLLVTAAAGGVGLLLVQWARRLGARVIGVVGDESKVKSARRAGCQVVLVGYEDMPRRVRLATRGAGVDVAYDGVGQSTFMPSLDCLKTRGHMVSFGNASGPPPAISPLELMRRGSLTLTRPFLAHYVTDPLPRARAARALFAGLSGGWLKVEIGQTFALRDAARAHAELEARRTTGCTVLLP